MKQILIIDDEEDILKVTKLCLELEGGWKVLTANSSVSGLEVAEHSQPDAILLDVMMPGIDGITTVQHLKANPITQSIPVVFLTAKLSPDEYKNWLDLGVIAIITKPFDPLEISHQICQALGW